MRNYTIPEHPIYGEEIRMLENTDPADADSVFNPLFSKMINNTAAIRSKFNGVTMKDEYIVNIPNTRDYDYLSLELCGNTRVTPENPALEISPENVARIESVGENGVVNVISSGKNLIRPIDFPKTENGITAMYDETTGVFTFNGTVASGLYAMFHLLPSMQYKKGTSFTQSIIRIGGINSELARLHTEARVNGQWSWENCIYTDLLPLAETALSSKKLPSDNSAYVAIGIKGTVSNLKLKIQKEPSMLSTPFEKPLSTIPILIPLKCADGNKLEPLRSLPDGTKDRVIKKDGVWSVERNTFGKILNGMEGWSPYKNFMNTVSFSYNTETKIKYVEGNANGTVNRAIYKGSVQYNDIEGFMAIGAHFYLGINRSWLETPNLEGFKKWLANNNLIILLTMSEPIYQPLHPNTQTILNNLARTYDGTTVIMGTDEISPLITSTYARGAMSTLNAKQISGCEVNDEIIGDRNLLTAGKTVALINSMITERLEATK